MSGKHQKAFTKEEELLLQDFSRNVSTKSSALFYGNAFIVSANPIWLFWRIHMIDLLSSLIFFIIVTLASTYLVALAYKNTKFVLKHKIAVKREEAVTREMSKKLSEDKKMSKKEKDERILWKKNEIADYEATTFSIFYNNALFLALVIFSSFYLLKSFSPSINYVLSVSCAGGLLALLSTSSHTTTATLAITLVWSVDRPRLMAKAVIVLVLLIAASSVTTSLYLFDDMKYIKDEKNLKILKNSKTNRIFVHEFE